ncbi:DUF4328 domain-containing protein [Kitasatospora sp. YST-16]|uniref:DUF4328 domain-containing protein n=1 Tax=Kitasatospora sp. YST-16 TaxID=2998080 RepID=UPI00228489F9|nr:DUF4328 domain-containing protein [Kitasatospora sp. YST-16]WAL74383.1 DUF4328 domain-containing protein [Kitasatospora sp. YST-16]
MVREVLLALVLWRDYFLIHGVLAGTVPQEDLDSFLSNPFVDLIGSIWAALFLRLVAGVAFVVWLWRARVNAEVIGGAASQRRARGWVLGGWGAPVANMWVPYQVVSDVWRASSPRRDAAPVMVRVWWVLLLLSNVVLTPLQWQAVENVQSEADVLSAALLTTVLALCIGLAGVLAVTIVKDVTGWQSGRVGEGES